MNLGEAILHCPVDEGEGDPITLFAARIDGRWVSDSPAAVAAVDVEMPIEEAAPADPPGLEYFLEASVVHEVRAQLQRRHGSQAIPDDALIRGVIYYAENDAPPPV